MVAVLLVVTAGCGSDPKTSRLQQGDRVLIIFDVAGKSLDVAGIYTKRGPTQKESEVVAVSPATRAIVLHDEEKVIGGSPQMRWVQVKIDEGENAGTVGDVMRGWLRPAK